ncbi:hypothetical protein K2173_004079 [Erythroxylum novogranatense]|uniref:Protein MIS12 homolog n=1 Tax=Erythroxylum novogranatense TaxID=1862640 RepID=A0AAV8SJQ2_9ROSI|nr:hypothetical protein K2173_004079 [Erythroxylum novogranatense]
MERSESEAVFESLSLNPQIFINETLNTVDYLLDDAFHFFSQEASKLLRTEGTERSQSLSRGIAYIRNKIQSDLDTRLGMWEKYCLHHCFSLPKGFHLPESTEPIDENLVEQAELCDPALDMRLSSLRDRLTMIGKESAELNHELRELERQSASRDRCAAIVKEVLESYEQNSVHELFEEMTRTASELHVKIEDLGTRRAKDVECGRAKSFCESNGELPTLNHVKGRGSIKYLWFDTSAKSVMLRLSFIFCVFRPLRCEIGRI